MTPWRNHRFKQNHAPVSGRHGANVLRIAVACALFAAAGFELTRVVPTDSPLSVVEAKPRA